MMNSSQDSKIKTGKESEFASETETETKSESESETESEKPIPAEQSGQISYGIQVALMSLGGILGIISAILIIAFLFFGDLIRTFIL
ncbi:MAG: hypothetical protein WBH77_07925 [Saccharofermentanales bacterium]